MSNWLPRTISQIRDLAKKGKVSFTYKALREMAELELGLDELDVVQILMDLEETDFKERKASTITDEWLYIFLISIECFTVYLKLILRDNCVIISFHEDRPYE